MTNFKDIDLTGQTVEYNGISFGGSQSSIPMEPPNYQISLNPTYDDANRSVIHTTGVLQVSTVVFAGTEAELSKNMDILYDKLSQPGKKLFISGLGLGFVDLKKDTMWGPQPGIVNMEPIGDLAVILNWQISFKFSACGAITSATSELKAFNYSTSWLVSPEGYQTRTVSGYLEIPQTARDDGTVESMPDNVRELIDVEVPAGFRRATRQFLENPAKTRLAFSIVDTQIEGDALPVGIVQGRGNFSVQSGFPFVTTVATLSATYRTAQRVNRTTASLFFMRLANVQQQFMQQRVGKKGAVIPLSLNVNRGLYGDAETTTFSISWTVTHTTPSFSNAIDLSNGPVIDSNADAWAKSMDEIWVNRGTAQLESDASSDVVLNLCEARVLPTIRSLAKKGLALGAPLTASLSCGSIPVEASWLQYEARLQVRQRRRANTYSMATQYTPPSQFKGSVNALETFVDLPMGVTAANGEADITDHHGIPETWVLLTFRGIRVGHTPSMPILVSIDGNKVTPEDLDDHNFKVDTINHFVCDMYRITGYHVYRIRGNVNELKGVLEDPTISGVFNIQDDP